MRARPEAGAAAVVRPAGGPCGPVFGVSSAEAIATAGRIASQVDGIVCIDNRLKVGPPEASDREAVRP